MQLSNERIGSFTASRISELTIGVRGGSATRDKYVYQKAVEKLTGITNRSIKTYAIEHGQFNEYEALEAFKTVTGLNIVYGTQQYFKVCENSGATPDGFEQDFDNNNIATIDAKCPQPDGFYEQKMLMVNEGKPQYQNVPKSYFYQAQMQMMAVGVDKHYLVRYLAQYFENESGDLIEVDLPLEQRIFYSEITKDEAVQEEIRSMIKSAVEERDLLIKIFKQPIL